MNKSLIIDFKLLEELEIKVQHLLILYNTYIEQIIFDIVINDELEYLEKKRYIKIVDNNIILRQSSIDLIELLTVDNNNSFSKGKKIVKKSSRVVNNEIDNRIAEYRNLWRGLKPGSMGSLQSCKDKMTRWMKCNPEYSFDDIINAAKLYLRTEGMNVRFLQRADYFIYKQENNREESSRLSAFIDEIGDNDSIEDWTSTLN